MKSFRCFLTEALIEVDASDINLIYAPLAKPMKELNAVFKEHMKRFTSAGDAATERAVARTIQRELLEVLSKYQPASNNPIKTIDTSKLKSETAKAAHKINPIKIHVWLVGPPNMPNHYSVDYKEINICLQRGIADAMTQHLAMIPKHQLEMLSNETSDLKYKTTIRHELTHWIDDSLHNMYLTKALLRTDDLQRYVSPEAAHKYYDKVVKHGQEDIYLAPIEVTAMVNQIAELKRRIGEKKFNNITWSQVITYLPSLASLNTKFGEKYRKVMFTRLARENLIGDKFRDKLK